MIGYSTLSFCICDYITDWPVLRNFLADPIEGKLATHEINYIGLHNTRIMPLSTTNKPKQHTSDKRAA